MSVAVSSVQLLTAGDGSGSSTPTLRRTFCNSPLLQKAKFKDLSPRFPRNRFALAGGFSKTRIKINVSGTIFETLETTLDRFPKTLLGDKTKRSKHYDSIQRCLFFDRCRISFEAILFYYQSGGYLIRPTDKDMTDFEKECFFYGLEETAILSMKEREGYARHEAPSQDAVDKTCCSSLHSFLENPNSSKPAKVFAVLSMLMIVGSVILACLSTMSQFRDDHASSIFNSPLSVIELIMNIFFGLELILRFISAPKKFSFWKSPLNILDLFAVVPYFIFFAFDDTQITYLGFIKAFRTIRVLRFLRFSRHSDTLRVVINILSSSVRDLLTVVFCMLLMSISWGSLAYYIEVGSEETQFISILDGMWWAIQTIVCLGYGDIVPVTFPGKVAGSIVAAVGALTLTVPLLSIGGRYLQMYSRTFSINCSLDINENDKANSKQQSL
ncbi:potassium voltage-gated channel subfamily A member 1-like [Rhopilema esculentum]|uniref:potassium voltage-gated channel subfamily A member 1-like n=1 Tax=Rhopilema esculentum TaxID=499914 RepID=UPI0031D250ED